MTCSQTDTMADFNQLVYNNGRTKSHRNDH